MRWRNDRHRYGLVALALHWLVAAAVFGLFALGLWMTELSYYDRWYRLGPWWHKGVGVLLFGAVLFRLGWRRLDPTPAPEPGHRGWERAAAHGVHIALYLLLLAVMLSGYLISTADGRALAVFGWFSVPASLSGERQEEWAGTAHLLLAYALVATAGLHAAAALKHHLVDRDRTLKRMLGL